MTYEQKLRDEYRIGYKEGFADGVEMGKKNIVAALKGALEPGEIAECFKLPLEEVLEILSQAQA